MQEELRYLVRATHPEHHLFEVTLSCWLPAGAITLFMPVWTPGSYLVREYAHHVRMQTVSAPMAKIRKNAWRLEHDGGELTVRYAVFAHELSVRSNHLDQSQGFFTGAALFICPEGCEGLPIRISLELPPGWQAFTALRPADDQPLTFLADNLDTLIDSPVQLGPHRVYAFQALEVPHRLIWPAGPSNANPEQICADIGRIVTENASIFGTLPYPDYTFLLSLSDDGFGGLEHHRSAALVYPRLGFKPTKSYERFLTLVAHEHFHVWNVKLLHPKTLGPFDYQHENYTRLLWAMEGITAYYEWLVLCRAGLLSAQRALSRLAAAINAYHALPASTAQSLSDASLNAWIDYYRQDAETPNVHVSYYTKGALVGLCLDLWLRSQSQGRTCLDDVLRLLLKRYGGSGFPEEAWRGAAEEVHQGSLAWFFDRYVEGTDALDWEPFLSPFGLRLIPTEPGPPTARRTLGLALAATHGPARIKHVFTDGPALAAGLAPGDTLLALNGVTVHAEDLDRQLAAWEGSETLTVHYAQRGLLCEGTLRLAAPHAQTYDLGRLPQTDQAADALFRAWLRTPLASLPERIEAD